MSGTIQELYLKYVNSIGASLEDDRYFRYLIEVARAGEHEISQTRQVLHKVVDEAWLEIIEDTLESINNIIENPRRFITTDAEVVPVSLAKKITAESVRHLIMNTQFITANDDGEIRPTKILNVSTEESYDLYENRFIYHLIRKLTNFIDKRTDVIFWSTGDETRNTMSLSSKIDDAYEEIEYKLELKIKNRQNMAENDADNMETFKRIDRVRRLTMALRSSPFCELMANCAMVRSPIQRTNLLTKDPDYRKCYQLWQFLERYDDVGYSIEEQNTPMEFDDEYLLQLMIGLVNNYTVFKSINEADIRDIDKAAETVRQVIKPKFVKEIHEEIVDDYNIPDVEIRQVIIEEVTQAQLDAEARLEEEIILRKSAEEEAAAIRIEYERAVAECEEYQRLAENANAQKDAAVQTAAEAILAKEQAESERSDALRQTETANAAREEAESARYIAEQERLIAVKHARAMEQNAAEAESARLEAEEASHQAMQKLEMAQQYLTLAQTERNQAKAAMEDAVKRADIADAARSEAEKKSEADTAARREAELLRDEAIKAKAVADSERENAEKLRSEAVEAYNFTSSRLAQAEKDNSLLKNEYLDIQERIKNVTAARREAERLRANTEKDMELLEKVRQQAEADRDAALNDAERSRADAEARIAEAKASCDSELARIRAEAQSREDELRAQLAKTAKKLERTQRRLEISRRIFGFGKNNAYIEPEDDQDDSDSGSASV